LSSSFSFSGALLTRRDCVGWVPTTEIGGGIEDWVAKYAPDLPRVPVQESAAAVVKIFETLTFKDTNSFFNYDGTKLPW
jgi:hypothetical protein